MRDELVAGFKNLVIATQNAISSEEAED